ncbi:MAG: peptidylprolyl isomerase [Calditrichaceae bacterium]
MISKYFIVLLSFFYLIGCSSNDDQRPDSWTALKKLEFSRSGDINAFIKIYSESDIDLKIETIRSMGRVKDELFIPHLKEVLITEKNPDLLKEAVFSLGQIGNSETENILCNLSFSNLPISVKKSILLTLGNFGGEKSVRLFQRYFNDPDIQKEVFIAAALSAKRGISVLGIKEEIDEQDPVSEELAYFYFYSTPQRDLDFLISELKYADVHSAKYLYKKIDGWYSKDVDLVTAHIRSDSIQFNNFESSLANTFKPGSPWQTLYYALRLFPVVADSSDLSLVRKYTSAENIHLKLAALQALAKISEEKSIAILLNTINETEDMYLKAEVIKIMAGINKNMAYRSVMQNLDQGNDAFKQSLLETLSLLDMPLATDLLHQFVNVASPALAEKAFGLLADKHNIHQSDFIALLESESFSSVATAIDWKIDRNQPVAINKLLELYSKFRQPSESELQLVIIKLLIKTKADLSENELKILADNASHQHVLKALMDLSGKNDNYQYRADSLANLSPAYLSPDSLNRFSANPKILIRTEKGAMVMELYPKMAPLTVHNFLTLANKKFYNNLTFHRMVTDFVIQGGDPMGNGWGGPGYTIPSEHSDLPFIRGSVGIATSGWDTGGCQFFICQSEQFHLNGNYTLFGQVVEGLDIIDQIVPGDKIIGIDTVH